MPQMTMCAKKKVTDAERCRQNPSRPMEPHERKVFEENDWKLITASQV